MFTINSEHPYSVDHFEGKFQDKMYTSNQSFEKLEEELNPIKNSYIKAMNNNIATMIEKINDTLTNEKDDKIIELLSKQSEIIQNEVLTITSENPSSEDHFDRKFQDNIYPSNQIFEQPEEKLTEFKTILIRTH